MIECGCSETFIYVVGNWTENKDDVIFILSHFKSTDDSIAVSLMFKL